MQDAFRYHLYINSNVNVMLLCTEQYGPTWGIQICIFMGGGGQMEKKIKYKNIISYIYYIYIYI